MVNLRHETGRNICNLTLTKYANVFTFSGCKYWSRSETWSLYTKKQFQLCSTMDHIRKYPVSSISWYTWAIFLRVVLQKENINKWFNPSRIRGEKRTIFLLFSWHPFTGHNKISYLDANFCVRRYFSQRGKLNDSTFWDKMAAGWIHDQSCVAIKYN